MAKYHLHLKGYVGASDFRTNDVDKCLAQNADNDVRVLIDSTGGSLGAGLSIAAAFKNHGAVDVHFVGLNASAATVASLGARTVTIDRAAMYLVHKCSNVIFAWDSMNADELEDYIQQLTQNKQDLDKIDDNISAMYAARCRKDKNDLLDLMKVGGWLSPKEALEWGFVDKITDFANDEEPVITNSLADDFKAAGIPVPGKIQEKKSVIKEILEGCRQFFSAGRSNEIEANASSVDKTDRKDSKDTKDPKDNEGAHTSEASDSQEADAQNLTPAIEEEPENKRTLNVIDFGGKKSNDSLSSFFETSDSARSLFDSLP